MSLCNGTIQIHTTHRYCGTYLGGMALGYLLDLGFLAGKNTRKKVGRVM